MPPKAGASSHARRAPRERGEAGDHAPRTHSALLLADAERLENLDHARGVRLPYALNMVDIGAGAQFEPAFLSISPNNRMPAIVDPDGPDGAPISVFESGAILQYLARKTGRFGGSSERERVAVAEWLFWQVGGLGPMAG